MTRSSASIRTSEPAFRPHTSQWQRENMGRVEPMEVPLTPTERWYASLALWVAIWGSMAVLWAVLA